MASQKAGVILSRSEQQLVLLSLRLMTSSQKIVYMADSELHWG